MRKNLIESGVAPIEPLKIIIYNLQGPSEPRYYKFLRVWKFFYEIDGTALQTSHKSEN